MKAWASALIVSCLLFGCSSFDDRLYRPGPPPILQDGTISMRTSWSPGENSKIDIRRVKARDGVVTCELISPDRGHFVGSVPEARWVELWNTFLAMDPFRTKPYGVDADDPAGGPYHVIRLELGPKGHEFSAQMRTNILIFSSKDISERLRYSGQIVDFVSEFATERLGDAPPSEAPKATPTPETPGS